MQGQGNCLAPCCRIARGGTRLVNAADDVAHALIDRLAATILLDLLLLIFPQEQRDSLRRCQHGKLGGQGSGQVVSKLKRILFSAPVGVAVLFTLCEYLTEPPEVLCNLTELGLAAYLCQ